MFRIPYYQPPWNPGQQIINLGQGGPASHSALLAMQPRSYPTVFGVHNYGMSLISPRQVIGPTPFIDVNDYSNPLPENNLVINGIFKNPVGG